MITVAGQILFENETDLDNSNQIIKGYEKYIGDNEIKNDILDKVCGDNEKDICSEKDEVYKKNSINRFIRNLNDGKRELKSNKYLLWVKSINILLLIFLCARYKIL